MSTTPPCSQDGFSNSWTDHVLTRPAPLPNALLSLADALDDAPFDIPNDAISRHILSKYFPELELPSPGMLLQPLLAPAFVDYVHLKLAEAERLATPAELGIVMPTRVVDERQPHDSEEQETTRVTYASFAKRVANTHYDKWAVAYKMKKDTEELDEEIQCWLSEIDDMPTQELFAAFLKFRHPHLKRSVSVAFGDEAETQGSSKSARDMIARYASSTNIHAEAVRDIQSDAVKLQLLEMKCTQHLARADRANQEAADVISKHHARALYQSGHFPSLGPIAINGLRMYTQHWNEHQTQEDDTDSEVSSVDDSDYEDFDPTAIYFEGIDHSTAALKKDGKRDSSSISGLSSCRDDEESDSEDDDDDEAPAQALAIVGGAKQAKDSVGVIYDAKHVEYAGYNLHGNTCSALAIAQWLATS